MADLLRTYEEKWHRKAIAGFKQKWPTIVKKSESYEAYCQGIAAVTGLSPDEVRRSFPAEEWRKFSQDPEKYLDIAVRKIEAAYSARSWSTGYKQAFSPR